MISMYPPGSGRKVRVFAIPNAESRHYFVSPMIGVCRSPSHKMELSINPLREGESQI